MRFCEKLFKVVLCLQWAASTAYALDCDVNHRGAIASLQEFTEIFHEKWSAPFSENSCALDKLSNSCQRVFSSIEFKNTNWKVYSAACSGEARAEEDVLTVIAGCTSFVKDLGETVGEAAGFLMNSNFRKYLAEAVGSSMNDQAEYQRTMHECSQSTLAKQQMILEYNLNLPEVLKYRVKKNIDYKGMTCDRLQSLLKRHFKSNFQRQIATIPLNVPDAELTPEQLQFKLWRSIQPIIKMDINIFQILTQKTRDSVCYNKYYRTKYICETAISLGILGFRAAHVSHKMALATAEEAKNAKAAKKAVDKMLDKAYRAAKAADEEARQELGVSTPAFLARVEAKRQRILTKIKYQEAALAADPRGKYFQAVSNNSTIVKVEKVLPDGLVSTVRIQQTPNGLRELPEIWPVNLLIPVAP